MSTKLIISLAALLITANAHALLVPVDFDALADGTIVTAGTDLGGVVFDVELQIDDGDVTTPIPGGSAPNSAFSNWTFPAGVFGTFTSPVSMISVLAGDSGGDMDAMRLDAFDAGGSLVDSEFLTSPLGEVLTGPILAGICRSR